MEILVVFLLFKLGYTTLAWLGIGCCIFDLICAIEHQNKHEKLEKKYK